MFAFELWREFRLSIAEIIAIFPKGNIIFLNKQILLLENISKEEILNNAKKIWWTIKVIEIYWTKNLDDIKSQINDIFLNDLNILWYIWKFNYWVSLYWKSDISLKEILKISKNVVKSLWLNPRFINKDDKNISSVMIVKEALIKKETDFNFIFFEDKLSFWKTIFVQDFYSYSNRDYGKITDMNIGMLPPKLAQMMINIGNTNSKDNSVIYDPFVWLWTVLIESIYMWNKLVFWSDISDRMVNTTIENLSKLKSKLEFESEIIMQNAKYISEINFLDKVDLIVTEWYLWEIMTKSNISIERIDKQTKKLKDLYEWFFLWLKNLWFKWNIVISFPFWDLKWKYLFFEDIYAIINKYLLVNELLPNDLEFQTTKMWSLLYKRDSQLVWREIFNLKIK